MLLIRMQNAASNSARTDSAVLALIGRGPITQLTIHAGDHAKEVRILLSPIAFVGGREHCRRDNVSMKVDAVLHIDVVNPERVVMRVAFTPNREGIAREIVGIAPSDARVSTFRPCSWQSADRYEGSHWHV